MSQEDTTAGELSTQGLLASEPPPVAPSTSSLLDAGSMPMREVSAATVGRMLGLATVSELKVIEGKIDVLSTKITALTMKIDKIVAATSLIPSGSDFERIDLQLGALRALIKDNGGVGGSASTAPSSGSTAASSGSSGSTDGAKKRPSVFVSKSSEPTS
jgi:hypothetical protein